MTIKTARNKYVITQSMSLTAVQSSVKRAQTSICNKWMRTWQ